MHEELIRQAAQKHGVGAALLQALIDHEQTKVHMLKRRGVADQLRKLIEEHADRAEA